MWNLGKACVIIHVKGKNAERLLNALRGDGMALWRITRIASDELRLSMRARDFRRIRRHAGRLHCHVHIVGRDGASFVLMRLMRRRMLWIGCLTGLALVLAASTRLWLIRVEGNERVSENTVRRALAENGVKWGAALPDGDFEALADAIASYDERIAWIGLDLDGVCLRVSVVEADYEILALDPTLPCDVVAVKDGVITDMRALEGAEQFSKGDAVRAGDVLIAGTVALQDVPQPLLVHARGLVKASVYYFSEFAQPLLTTERGPTGALAEYRRIAVCGLTLFESAAPFADFEIANCAERLLRLPLLPVSVCEGSYEEMTLRDCLLTEAEAAEIALVEAEKGALLRIPSDAAIVQKTGSWMALDGVVIATCAIVTEESIGMTKEIEN